MTEQDFKNKVAEKIMFYRKAAGMKQSDLAEKLNYSDKSVSKWERGESLPDVYVLSQLADIFGITLNDLTNLEEPKPINKKSRKPYVVLLSIGIAWLCAAIIFFALKMAHRDFSKAWIAFIYAIPVSFILATVFACLWYSNLLKAASISGIIWGMFLSIFLSYPAPEMTYLLIACGIFQIMVIIWFIMKRKKA